MKRKLEIRLTDGLALKVPSPQMGPLLFTLIDENRDFLRNWLPWLDTVNHPKDSIQFLETNWNNFETGRGFNYGIFYQQQLVGLIGYVSLDRSNRVASVGYWLAKKANGKGLMTQSLIAVCENAFTVERMNRLYIRCATANRGSRNIPERLGFIHEGTQRDAEWLYDHFVDHEVYSLLEREWAGYDLALQQLNERQGGLKT